MKEKKKLLSKYKRKIIIDGQEWTWQLSGKSAHAQKLSICNPSQTAKYTFDISTLANPFRCERVSHDEFFDCTCDYCTQKVQPFTPKDVERIIRDNEKDDWYWYYQRRKNKSRSHREQYQKMLRKKL